MISDSRPEYTSRWSNPGIKGPPPVKKWNMTTSEPYASPELGQLRENVKQLMGPNREKCFPEVYDGASQWYSTVERLSRKVTTQRHELWEVQEKLRAEVENSQNLSKTLQLDRREYKEVVSALTSKIDNLERQLAKQKPQYGRVDRATLTHPARTVSSSFPPAETSSENVANSKNDGDITENDPIVTLSQEIQQLRIEMRELKTENNQLRQLLALRTEFESKTKTSTHSNVDPTIPGQNGDMIGTSPIPGQQPSPQRNYPAQNSTPNHTPSEPAPKGRSQIFEDELKRVLSSNLELSEKLKAQSEEMAQQRSHFQFLRTLMERSLNQKDPSSHHKNGKHHPYSEDKKSTSRQSVTGSPSIDSVPSLSSSGSSIGSDAEPNESIHSLPNLLVTPLPNQQSSVHHTRRTSPRSSVASTAAAPYTSTPSIRDEPSLSVTTDSEETSSKLQRLETLYQTLRRKELSEDEIRRYENIYKNSPQILAERPQLNSQTRQLIQYLEQNAPKKHAGIFRRLNTDLEQPL